MRAETARLWTLVEPHVAGAKLDLIELHWGQEPTGWMLRVFIDVPVGGAPMLPGGVPSPDIFPPAPTAPPAPPATVTHQDCERVSRDLSAALDACNATPHAYHLEVSSPGLDRPLRRLQDFARFSGRTAKVRTWDAIDGRRNFTGVLLASSDGLVRLDCDGRRYEVPVDLVARANLVPDWDAEFSRAGRTPPNPPHESSRSAS